MIQDDQEPSGHMSPSIESFWAEAAAALGVPVQTPYLAGPIARCDETTPPEERAMVDELADLAARHLKRGTCHLAREFEVEDTPVRRVGDLWVILRADGSPACIVRMIAIHTLPFDRVGPEFAALEGPEGGLIPSHANWWRAHRDYFQAQCARWGVDYEDDLPVVCESFITVYSPDHPIRA